MAVQPPPPRYRVVEQGRRLVVIDTLTGAPAVRGASSASAQMSAAVPQRIAFDGRSTLVTRRFYDDRGPRPLTLDPGATALIERARGVAIALVVAFAVFVIVYPWLLLLPLALFNLKLRAAIRAAATRWLDRYDAAPSAG